MSVHELEQMLWRYEYGRLSSARLERELREQLQRLVDARAVQGTPIAVARWQATALFTERDAALRSVSTAIDSHRFRDAVREIRRCSDTIAEVGQFLDASLSVGAAEQSVDTIGELAAGDALRQLPAIASLRQLAGTMSFRMMEGRYHAAALLAALCRRMTAPLLLRRPMSLDERTEAKARIAAVEELYESTNMVAGDAEPDARDDGSLDRLRNLVRDDYADLVKRLLIELEIGLAPRRRFRLHIRGVPDPGEVAALKGLVASQGWNAAVDHHALQAIANSSATFALHFERAASAAANLDAALADEIQET